MTEEEYFRKNYPDYCYGDRLLSPYWDLFQYGVEFGERQSEKKIKELKKRLVFARAEFQRQYKENEELVKTAETFQATAYKSSVLFTKAKGVIKQFLNDYPVITKEILDKLEQLIKEIEK